MSRETLRQRLEAATPRPWESYGYSLIAVLPDDSGRDLGDLGDGPNPEADATFTAHARQDIPALLAVADAAVELFKHHGEVVCSASAWSRECQTAHERFEKALAALEALP